MQRSITYSLLITWFLLLGSCKTYYVHSSIENRNLIVSDSLITLDSQIINIYIPYKLELEKDMNRVISVTAEEMVKEKPESNLTNFLADLLLEEGKKISTDLTLNFKPDISFYNYGGIRTFLPKGEITVGKVFELMPFENELVFLKLTGKQVQEFLNQIAEKGGDSLGGVRFAISNNRAQNVKVGGELLHDEKEYWLATNDYVAAGGDGLEVLTQRIDLIAGNKKIRDVIITHLEKKHKNGEPIFVKPDGRISNE
jgi:2',3'-cyclic-nucleotide 2'-phosphodiesterase (5'-nucleotidase family)